MNTWNSEKEKDTWRRDVEIEKLKILKAKELHPCEVLLSVFEWCIDNYDENCLEEKLPKLYESLKSLYDINEVRPIKKSLEENFYNINDVIFIFNSNKLEIKKHDKYLYLALSKFVNFLKTPEGHRIFWRIK